LGDTDVAALAESDAPATRPTLSTAIESARVTTCFIAYPRLGSDGVCTTTP
jgi:hypothetical protein